MKVRVHLVFLITVSLLIITFTSCRKSIFNKLKGKWEYINVKWPEGYNKAAGPMPDKTYWEFKDGETLTKTFIYPASVDVKRFSYSCGGKNDLKIWSYDQNKNSGYPKYRIIKLNKEKLVIQYMVKEEGMKNAVVATTYEFLRVNE